MKNVIIVGLLGLLVWFGTVIIRLESYHYASQLGMCDAANSPPPDLLQRDKCLNETETRTGWYWHLYYALRDGS